MRIALLLLHTRGDGNCVGVELEQRVDELVPPCHQSVTANVTGIQYCLPERRMASTAMMSVQKVPAR